MAHAPHLKLVSYNPSDYSLSDVFSSEHLEPMEQNQKIAAALSLYFQWPEHRRTLVYNESDSTFIECTLDYDRDERELTHILIKLADAADVSKLQETLRIRFEVFRTCFEFSAKIVYRSDNPEQDGWDVVVNVPSQVMLYKHRRLPRVKLSQKSEATHIRNTTFEGHALEATEISMFSLVAKSSEQGSTLPESGILAFGEEKFFARIVKSTDDTYVFVLDFESDYDVGRFFDIYRLAAYPALHPRYEFSEETLINLQKSTGYYDKFKNSDLHDFAVSETSRIWSTTRKSWHHSVAEYVITDQEDQPTGISCLAKAFIDCDGDIWSFHHLCAIRMPELLHESGTLYTWRAEYLAARKKSLKACGRYTSRSRWLERVYTKFHVATNHQAELIPIATTFKNFIPETVKESIPIDEITIGLDKRYCCHIEDKAIAGIRPTYINASKNLDIIYFKDPNFSSETINKMGQNLVDLDEPIGETSIAISGPYESSYFESGVKKYPVSTDRFFLFSKESLVDFIASIDHVVEVTFKKQQRTDETS